MGIELQFNSAAITSETLKNDYSQLLAAIQSYLPNKKTPKRRKASRKKETVASLIDGVIEELEIE